MNQIVSVGTELNVKPAPLLRCQPDEYTPIPRSFSFSTQKGLEIPKLVEDIPQFNNALIRGSTLLYDDPSIASQLLMLSKGYCDKIVAQSPDPATKLGEQDVAEKLSIQRRSAPYWFVTDSRNEGGQPSPLMKKCIDAYVRKIVSNLPQSFPTDPFQLMLMDEDPFDTNQGYPTFSKDPEVRFDTAAAIGLSTYSAEHVKSRVSQLSSDLGFPDTLLFPAAIAKRSGAVAKYQRYFVPDKLGMGVTSSAETIGYYTRARKVYMCPFFFNILASPVALRFKYGRMNTLGFWHDGPSSSRYMANFMPGQGEIIAESDMSGYDASIWVQTRKCLWDSCYKYGFSKDTLDILMMQEENTTVLSAPWHPYQRGNAAILTNRAGLLSGLKVTSELGCAISAAVTLKALVQTGLIPESCLEDGSWPLFLMQGDDVLLKIKESKLDEDKYASACAEEGLKVKFFRGRRFLMAHIYNGKAYGVGSRVIQQTLFNEDDYTHEGQIFLALASRLSKDFFPSHESILREWARAVSALVKSPDPFIIMADHPLREATALLLAHPSVDIFLKSAEGMHWLTALAYEAQTLPHRKEQLQRLLDLGYAPTASTDAIKSLRYLLVKKLFTNDSSSRAAALTAVRKVINW